MGLVYLKLFVFLYISVFLKQKYKNEQCFEIKAPAVSAPKVNKERAASKEKGTGATTFNRHFIFNLSS